MDREIEGIIEECTAMLLEIQSLGRIVPEIRRMAEDFKAGAVSEREALTALLKEEKAIVSRDLSDLSKRSEELLDAVKRVEEAKAEMAELVEENKRLQQSILKQQKDLDLRLDRIMAQDQPAPPESEILAASEKAAAEGPSEEDLSWSDGFQGDLKELIAMREGSFPVDVRRVNANWPEKMHFVITHTEGAYAHGFEYLGKKEGRGRIYPLQRDGYRFEFYRG